MLSIQCKINLTIWSPQPKGYESVKLCSQQGEGQLPSRLPPSSFKCCSIQMGIRSRHHFTPPSLTTSASPANSFSLPTKWKFQIFPKLVSSASHIGLVPSEPLMLEGPFIFGTISIKSAALKSSTSFVYIFVVIIIMFIIHKIYPRTGVPQISKINISHPKTNMKF